MKRAQLEAIVGYPLEAGARGPALPGAGLPAKAVCIFVTSDHQGEVTILVSTKANGVAKRFFDPKILEDTLGPPEAITGLAKRASFL